jgi:diaminohydroxyphosphoribosylaminopyrimidine deaminase / 5-amino-6-(5-phosphoribosylamino)uracil reductase
VVDSRGRIPLTARLADPSLPGCTLVATTPGGAERLPGELRERTEVWVGEPGPDGRVQPAQLLAELGRRSLISALVESGGTLLASLVEQRLVDQVAAFVAPKLVGGVDAPGPIGGRGVEDMSAALELVDVTYEKVGRDLLVRGYIPAREEGVVQRSTFNVQRQQPQGCPSHGAGRDADRPRTLNVER